MVGKRQIRAADITRDGWGKKEEKPAIAARPMET